MPDKSASDQLNELSANLLAAFACGTTREVTPEGRPKNVMSAWVVDGSPSLMPRSALPWERAAVTVIPIGMVALTVGV